MSVETSTRLQRSERAATARSGAPGLRGPARQASPPGGPARVAVTIVIDACADSAFRHECGAMVTPRFGVGGDEVCPRCHETI